MLTINRLLARQFRAVARRVLNITPRLVANTAVQLLSGPDGLAIRCARGGAAVEWRDCASQPSESLTVPLTLFEDCEGRRAEPVTIEQDGKQQIAGQWRDGKVPQIYRYDQPPVDLEFPQVPQQFTPNPPGLLNLLHQAMGIADHGSHRYALNHIRLRGTDGSVAATDGRHLFCESGYQFGFEEDALVPRTSVFGCSELPHDQPVSIGLHDGWLAVRVGSWTLLWKLDPELRFPRIEDHLRAGDTDQTTLDLGGNDAEFLREALMTFPVEDDAAPWVTVDLNGSVAIRSQPTNRPRPVELILKNSHRSGAELCFNSDSRYLIKALELGFRRFYITDPKGTVVCRNGLSHYVWMLLDPQGAIDASVEMDRIESTAIPDTTHLQPQSPAKEHKTMTTPDPVPAQPASKKLQRKRPGGKNDLIDQAEMLRDSLRQSLTQAVELIRSLRRHRQQSKLMRSTLASLKQLQTVGD